MLYHVNFGFPLLAEGTELIAPSKSVVPRDEIAAPGLDTHARYEAPVDGYQEKVFYHDMVAGADGYVTVVLANRKYDIGQGLGIYLRYRQAELPRFIQWKNVCAGTYVTGLEPANCGVEGRDKDRERGILQHLQEEGWDTSDFHGKSAQAIYELGELKAAEAVPYLLAHLGREVSRIMRDRAITALGKIGDARAVDPLIPFLRQDEVPASAEDSAYLRVRAIRALTALRAKGTLPDVKACLQDADPWVRAAAADAVAELGGPADLEALEPLRNDPDESVRKVVESVLQRRTEQTPQ